jgi:hypothetical protein
MRLIFIGFSLLGGKLLGIVSGAARRAPAVAKSLSAKLFLPLNIGIIYDDRTEEKPEVLFEQIFSF